MRSQTSFKGVMDKIVSGRSPWPYEFYCLSTIPFPRRFEKINAARRRVFCIVAHFSHSP